jgi:hypothetical protein
MRTTSIARTVALVVAAWMFGATSSAAYVDVELEGGAHVKGESYSSSPESGKLVVYRPSGAIEIDRSKVRSIREVDGSLTEDAALSQPSAAMAPAAPVAPVSAAPASAAPKQTRDPKERDRELSHQLMHMRLDRLAASQRGDQDTMKKLDKEIGSLQKERIDNYKKVDPSFDPESTK